MRLADLLNNRICSGRVLVSDNSIPIEKSKICPLGRIYKKLNSIAYFWVISCETLHAKMNLIGMKLGTHQDSFWQRSKRLLGNCYPKTNLRSMVVNSCILKVWCVVSLKFIFLPPISIVITEKIFSLSVLGATLPNPILVKLVKVKYRAVMYLVPDPGPLPGSDWFIGCSTTPASNWIQPYGTSISFWPITCQIQANQWAIRVNIAVSRKMTAMPYSE